MQTTCIQRVHTRIRFGIKWENAIVLKVRRFRPNKCGILFFSRGRGRGHAIPDHAIAAKLRRCIPDVDIRFVSYATGYRALNQFGEEVIDLKFSENNPLFPTLIMSARLIRSLNPDIIISHEEFVVPAAGAITNTYNIFITDWFLEDLNLFMQPLAHANSIICIDDAPFVNVPSFLKDKVEYSGPIIRPLDDHSGNSPMLRGELRIPDDVKIITVLPGGAMNSWESNTPILDLLFQAYKLLEVPKKLLIWVSDHDYEMLSSFADSHSGLMPMRSILEIGPLMRDSDLVITKANRITTLEASALGVRSLSLSHGTNPIDDDRVSRIRGHVPLRVADVDANQLAEVISSILQAPPPPKDVDYCIGLDRAVEMLGQHCEEAMQRRSRVRT